MDPILDRTRALAESIAGDPRTAALKAARERLEASPADVALQQRYHEAREKLAQLEAAQRPIEPAFKRELAQLENEVRHSQVLRALLIAHGEFAAMMDGVSQALSSAVDAALGTTPSEPPLD